MRRQFNLQDYLKDKSQKVETRDGRIVHNIWPVKEPLIFNDKRAEVCALIDGEEDALVFFEGGKYLTVNSESPFDLFIVTPEKEMTEFEIALENFVMNPDASEQTFHEDVKQHAAELLALARKQLIEEQYTSDPRKTDLYKLGKAEALNDLPRWKKAYKTCFVGDALIKDRYGIYFSATAKEGSIYILKSDLEKLPGFKED